jgi:hypothetical protein
MFIEEASSSLFKVVVFSRRYRTLFKDVDRLFKDVNFS